MSTSSPTSPEAGKDMTLYLYGADPRTCPGKKRIRDTLDSALKKLNSRTLVQLEKYTSPKKHCMRALIIIHIRLGYKIFKSKQDQTIPTEAWKLDDTIFNGFTFNAEKTKKTEEGEKEEEDEGKKSKKRKTLSNENAKAVLKEVSSVSIYPHISLFANSPTFSLL